MKRTHKLLSIALALLMLLSLLPGVAPAAAADTGTIRIYAIKKVGWENLYIHHWSSEGSETRNVLMTRINDSLYSADIPSNVVGISFNHGDFQYQTGDIKSGITNGAIFTVTGGTGNADAAPAPNYRLSAVMTTKGATVENDVLSLNYSNTLHLEYRLQFVSLVKDMEVKVYDDKGAWYPDQSTDSFRVPATGLYHVHFYPNGDGDADFYHGYFKLIPIVASVTAAGRTEYYEFFGQAVEYANATETNLNTLTLLADVVYNSNIEFQKETTLDLNGHSLTGIHDIHARTDYHDQTYYASNVTVTDSSDAGTGRLSCEQILVDSVSEVTVTGGTLVASDEYSAMELRPAGSPDAIHGTLTVTGSAVLEGTFENNYHGMPVVITGGATVEGTTRGCFTLAGGYYKREPDTSQIDENFKVRVPEESDKPGYYQLVPAYAAAIGDNCYHTLASAVTAAEDGDTIRLIDNISANAGNVELKKTITLDLNGYSLYNVDVFRIVVKSGGQNFQSSAVTIVDSAGGGKIVCNRVVVNSPNTLIIESGTIRHVQNSGTLELSPLGTNLYLATIIVRGTAVLDSNVYNGGDENPITITENATVNGALSAKQNSGGFRLSGGYYLTEPDSKWIPEEYFAIPPAQSDKPGYYRVGDYFPVRIGNQLFHDLASAVDAAQNNDTLVLVEDIDAGDSTVLLHKKITLDLNGHRLTNIHNLWIDTEGMTPAQVTIQDSSASGTGVVECYELWVSSISQLTVTGGTFRSQSGGSESLRLRMFGSAYYDGKMLFTGTSVLDGNIYSNGYYVVTIAGNARVNGNMSHWSGSSGGFVLTGGYYAIEPNAAYVAKGYKAVQITSGELLNWWQIVEHPVAQVGQTTYLSFPEAVTEAKGALIVLLDNIDDAYKLSVGETLTVAKQTFRLTVNAPDGDYLVSAVDTAAQGETPAYTTYTAVSAKAKIGTALYATFAEAASAAQGATVTLLADIAESYTLSAGETLKVAKGGFALTVQPPVGNYMLSAVDTAAQGETPAYTTYSSFPAAASVNGTLYATFQQAGDAAHGAVITLFMNVTEPYTLDGNEMLRVSKNNFTLTVNAPAGSFVLHEETQDGVTSYWLTGAVAQANGNNYDTFPAAVTAANGTAVTLLVDIQEPYTLAEEQTLRVNKNGHALTVGVPANCNLNTAQDGDTTVYSVIKLYAQVDDVKYESFSAAASAANGVKEITLLRSNNVAFDIQSVNYEILRVVENGHDANVVNSHSSETKNGVTYFHKTEESKGVSGSGFAYIAGGIAVAAGAYAIVYFDQPAGLAAGEISIVMGIDSVVEVEGVSDEMIADDMIEMEDPESQCIERESTDNGFRYKSLDIVIINIDTGISFLDTPGLPEWFSSVVDGYEQNTSSIVKIAPPTMKILGYTDARVIIPYPKGVFFPPIPYLPDALNPGNHFIAFFEDADVFSFGVPFIGRPIVEEYFEIGALWYPQEAAIVKEDGKLIYYNGFSDACEESKGEVVKILSAPMNDYVLKKTSTSGTATYETLKVLRGQYVGSCVAAPTDLPEGYALRSWTIDWQHKDGDKSVTDTVTCYTVGAELTVTFQPDNGESETTKTVITNQICEKIANPTKTGYTFVGWFEVTGNTVSTTAFDFSKKILSNVTLRAKWEKPAFASHSLSLDGNIGVNFYLSLPTGFNYTGSSMTFSITHGTCTESAPLPAKSANGYYLFTCYVNSIQMAETITATFRYNINGTQAETITDTFRVVDYFTYFDAHQNDKDLNGQPIYSQKAKDLIKAFKDYGYYVQHFLEPEKTWVFRTDNDPVGTGYAEVADSYNVLLAKDTVQNDAQNVQAFAKTDTVANSGYLENTFEKITYSLVLDTATTIKVFFKLKPGKEMPTIKIDNATDPYEPQLVGGRYVVLIENIKAQDLAMQHTITIGSNDATVHVSVLSYVNSMLNEVKAYAKDNEDAWKNSEHLAAPSKWTDAARALYTYWYYASAYVN